MEADSGKAPNPYVELAKAAIRAYVEHGRVISFTPVDAKLGYGAPSLQGSSGVTDSAGMQGSANAPSAPGSQGVPAHVPADVDLSPLFRARAGVFVSIKKNGELRGCIGTISPVRPDVANEIVANAISACSRDPRFDPVEPRELNDLTVSVDVLSEAEQITDISQLDASKYGVIVSKGMRRGLLLPNLEGVDDVGHQIAIALSKAGIRPSESYAVERFEVVRHEAGGKMRI